MTKSKHHYWIQNSIFFLSLWWHTCTVPNRNSRTFFNPKASDKNWRFRRGLHEICTIIGLHVGRNGSFLQTFRYNRQPIFRDQAVRLSHLWRWWPIDCTTTSGEKNKIFNSNPKFCVLTENINYMCKCVTVLHITDHFESNALTTVQDPYPNRCNYGVCISETAGARYRLLVEVNHVPSLLHAMRTRSV
jgi:hypothetical protein